MTLQQGKTYPALASSHPVRCHLLRRRSQTCSTAWRYKAVKGSWSGKGGNVCNRGGSKRVPLQRYSQGSLSSMALAEAGWYGGARKDKIELLCLWGEQLHTFTAILSVHFVHSGLRKLHRDKIHIPVNSLSLNADRSSHSFNQNGQSCETLDSCSSLLNFPITQGKA